MTNTTTDTTARLDEIERRDTLARIRGEISALSALLSNCNGLDLTDIREGVTSWLDRWQSDLDEVLQ